MRICGAFVIATKPRTAMAMNQITMTGPNSLPI